MCARGQRPQRLFPGGATSGCVQGKERDRNTLSGEDISRWIPGLCWTSSVLASRTGVFRKFKQGRYEAEAGLDLHRMTC